MDYDDTEMVRCPYDFSHVVRKLRLPGHLVKCRQRHMVDDYAVCPFNSAHDVPVVDLECHVKECPGRKNLENFIYVVGKPRPKDNLPPIEVPDSTENWDEDGPQMISYLDIKEEKLENERVFRIPVGLSKTERKAFFKNEVLKFERARRVKEESSNSTACDSECQGTSQDVRIDGGYSGRKSKKKSKKKKH